MMKLFRPFHFNLPPMIRAGIAAAALLAGFLAQAQNDAPAKALDFSAFRIISDRNIFNPNRYATSGRSNYHPTSATRRTPSVSFVGTLSYSEGETPGEYAFFDGTSYDYRKVLKQDDTIVGYKISAITPDSVTLTQDTNRIVLKMGMQLRDDGSGHWYLSDGTSSFGANYSSRGRRRGGNFNSRSFAGAPETAGANTDTNSTDNAESDVSTDADPSQPDNGGPDNNATPTITLPAGPAGDALQRLMQLRQQEEQQTGNRN